MSSVNLMNKFNVLFNHSNLMAYSILKFYIEYKMAYSELLYIYINKRSFPINYIIKSFFFSLFNFLLI